MIPESKFVEIAEGLLRKTKQGKLKWEQHPNDSYVARLPRSTVVIKMVSSVTSVTSPTYVLLEIRGPNGQSAGVWRVFEGEVNWQIPAELYGEIERGITGWDKVLEDIVRHRLRVDEFSTKAPSARLDEFDRRLTGGEHVEVAIAQAALRRSKRPNCTLTLIGIWVYIPGNVIATRSEVLLIGQGGFVASDRRQRGCEPP